MPDFDPASVSNGSTTEVFSARTLGLLHLSDPTSLLHVGNVAFVITGLMHCSIISIICLASAKSTVRAD